MGQGPAGLLSVRASGFCVAQDRGFSIKVLRPVKPFNVSKLDVNFCKKYVRSSKI